MVERLKVRLMGMVVWMVGGDTILKTFAKIWRFCLVERLKAESWVDWVGCMDGVDAILKTCGRLSLVLVWMLGYVDDRNIG